MEYELRPSKDEHGQPLRQFRFLRENNVAKAFDQLSGICHGILADGIVNESEAKYFGQWVQQHKHLMGEWPLNDVLKRLEGIYSDGVITAEEREDLADIMRIITGEQTGGETVEETSEARSSFLPIDLELPDPLVIAGCEFVLTGKFALGARKIVTRSITGIGGLVRDGFPTRATDYLVIGVFASRDWQFTNYGRKIEHAVSLKDSGNKIRILPESHLKRFLP